MKLFKSIALVVLLLFIAVATSGCSLFGSKTPVAPKVITIWGFDDEDVWKPFFKDASKILDGYEVVYVKKTLDDSYENNTLNSILSGKGPDVWAIPNDWVYRHKDKLAPMPDSLVKKTEINVEDMFVPAVKDSSIFDGKIFSLSPAVDTLMLYYNPEIFETVLNEYNDTHRGENNVEARREASRLLDQAPTTWSDIAKASNLITRKGGSSISRSGIALGTANNIARSQDILYALMLQNETAITSSDYKLATFNLPQNTNSGANDYPSRRALDFYTSFSDPNSANYSWNTTMSQDIESFASGQTSMIISYESFTNYLSQIYPNFKYQKSPLPQIGDRDDNVVDYASYTTYAVPALSKNVELAWKVIYSLSTDSASSYSSTVRVAHSQKKKDFIPSLTERSEEANPGKSQTQTAKVWIKGRYPEEIDRIFGSIIDNKISGKLDSQSALDLGANQITELLRKESW